MLFRDLNNRQMIKECKKSKKEWVFWRSSVGNEEKSNQQSKIWGIFTDF